MGWIELIGFTAGLIVSLSLLPQVVKSLKSKKTKDLSIMWLLISLFAQVLWATYGILKGAWPLLVTSIVVSIMNFVLIGLKRKYG